MEASKRTSLRHVAALGARRDLNIHPFLIPNGHSLKHGPARLRTYTYISAALDFSDAINDRWLLEQYQQVPATFFFLFLLFFFFFLFLSHHFCLFFCFCFMSSFLGRV